MASSYTEHFQLNQWAAEDPVLREDFNADNAKLDKAIPRIVTGTYTGDGTADRTISLGFRPKAVLLFPEDGTTCFYYCPPNYFTCQGGLILDGYPLRLKNDRCNIICAEITDTGFAVKIFSDQSKAANIATNRNGTVYHYLALA